MTVLAGRLVIVSGPSGSGKSTVVERLLASCPLPLTLSVSATTRKPREGEIDGRHYHFLSAKEFATRRQAGDFLECMEVYGQNWYGTLRSTVESGLASGQWVVLEIDVQGALKILQEMPDAITVAVLPKTLDELARRLKDRNTDSPQAVRRRLEVAESEIGLLKEHYQLQVVNDKLEEVVEQICSALQQYQETQA